ncbi:MAG: type II secretion system protein GspM [Rhodoferax sp.]|uniref:type II secretion system protein GspM n=1 Tax=Rhodoferax sp. TaxID=50421 RepID=UPI003263EF2F
MKLPASIRPHWDSLAPRERRSVQAALALVAVALLWWVGIGPALHTLGAADAQHRSLDAQLQTMHSLQAEAQALQAQPKLSFDDALKAVELAVKSELGGSGQINVTGERVTVSLKNTPADALARWLAQVRINARALPTEARLVRSQVGNLSTPVATWDGSLVLTLPSNR